MAHHHYKLLPRHRIMAFTGGEDGRPFVQLFRRCWQKMPALARRRILKHWRTSGWQPIPIIEFSNMWFDSLESFGQVGQRGLEIHFSADDCAVLPCTVCEWIVAHEMAHAYRHAIGVNVAAMSTEQNEQETDSVA
jgi:hypothetical protein